MKRIIVGITGASGSIYGKRVVEVLLEKGNEVFLVVTDTAKQVMSYELKIEYDKMVNNWHQLYGDRLHLMDVHNLFEPIASGSFHTDGMVIVPASMGTIGKIRHCISDNLLIRAADVCIKEKKTLIIVPRESPLSALHLENLLRLSQCGVQIFPPMPAFYHYPTSIEDMVNQSIGRIIEALGINNKLYQSWGEADNARS